MEQNKNKKQAIAKNIPHSFYYHTGETAKGKVQTHDFWWKLMESWKDLRALTL